MLREGLHLQSVQNAQASSVLQEGQGVHCCSYSYHVKAHERAALARYMCTLLPIKSGTAPSGHCGLYEPVVLNIISIKENYFSRYALARAALDVLNMKSVAWVDSTWHSIGCSPTTPEKRQLQKVRIFC